ncbi:MAG: hypothetical protein PHU24_11755 [Sphaerochaetaceae bacterium]|jgi:hypothetical protein|nr:hypothetical protein [Sphaerochaetaceae bacterium]NLO59682.1 hypothetical protein [Spirochaetales bacterium]MDD2407115.1 hypothetical protein [Sphaerochaetaceae bacterium]MDD3669758.1 hypothetical protein [Sphaerochaetaceae bacterium]MDD4259048.1 hypothetical protein [Sphaerochaetaceae bacterium]
MKNLKSLGIVLVLLVCSMSVLYAKQYVSVNDLEGMSITAKKEFDGFVFQAIDGKGITIEMIDQPRTASDGEIFNGRIKLNGGGTLEYRSIHFTVTGKATLTVYLNSSSKTDARVLVLANASGTEVTTMAAPPDTGTEAGIVTAQISGPGTYAIYSKSSGINIYQIVIE